MFGKKILDKNSNGTKYLSNPQKINSEHDYLRKKEYFNKNTLTRGVVAQVYFNVKDRKCWEEGITSDELLLKVKNTINRRRYSEGLKPKKISKGTIYSAVSKLNLFCDHIYIRNDFMNRKICLKCNDNFYYTLYETNCLKCQKQLDVIKEYRYFCPYEGEDLEKEKRKLIAQILRTRFKKQKLEKFEEQEIKQVEKIKVIKQEIIPNV